MILKICLFVIISFMISCSQIQKPIIENITPKVHFVIGEVSINSKPAKFGYTIQDGDILETSSKSYIEAYFGKQSAVRVREESRVVFNISDEIVIDVQKGKVLNILEKKSKYSVRTPSAVAAIRGTIFFANVLDEKRTYFCACNGTISLEDSQQNQLTQLSSSHHMPNITELDNGEVGLSAAEMMDHTDLEIFEFMYRLDQAIKE